MVTAEFHNYADSVIAYHQYKHELELSSSEARSHPDTLEVFGDMHDVVASSPDLVAAYTGALKRHGPNKTAGIEKVREIEHEIVDLLYAVDVMDDAEHNRERQALADDKAVQERARRFIRLFRSVIPKDQLPKNRRRNFHKTQAKEVTTEGASVDAAEPTERVDVQFGIDGLREGQEPAIKSILDYIDSRDLSEVRGHVVAPTGSGKTVLFAKTLEHLRAQERLPKTVIVVPTDFLKKQTLDELRLQGFKGTIQIAHSSKRHDESADVVIITQQGFARQLSNNGHSLDPEKVGLVIFDEAHHIGGERTEEVIKAKLSHAGIIGFTASPDYDSKRLLKNHLPDLIHEISTEEAVDWGLTAPYQTLLLPTHGNLMYAVPSGKDYHQSMLDRATNISPRNHLIARFLADHFLNERVMVNVNTVKHAHDLAEAMRLYGKRALAVSRQTRELDSIMGDFHDGSITGLVNARLLTESFNEVRVDAVTNATPTLSIVKQKQRVGRGGRIDPDNPYKVLKVIECVDNSYAKQPVLYGPITGHWSYGGGRKLEPFETIDAYGVIQDPEEIERWWNGAVDLSTIGNIDAESLGKYQPVSEASFAPQPKEHKPRRKSRRQEFDEVFNSSDENRVLDSIRHIGAAVTDFILEGRPFDEYPSTSTLRKVLSAMAGHDVLHASDVKKRYAALQGGLQQLVMAHSVDSEDAQVRTGFFFIDSNKTRPEWHNKAACVGLDPEMFYPGRGESTKEAKAICNACESKDDCLETALIKGDKFGIWGGLSERQRRVVRRVRKSGEATEQEVQVLIATLRGDITPDEEDEIDEFDDIFEQDVDEDEAA